MHHIGKKESEKDIKKKRKKKVEQHFLQGDSNPNPQNQLELKVNSSIHWTTLVNAGNASLKEVYIPSLWWLTVFKDDVFFFLISV